MDWGPTFAGQPCVDAWYEDLSASRWGAAVLISFYNTRSRTGITVLLAAVLWLTAGSAAGDMDAERLMAAVTAQLPPQPLALTGDLIVRLRRGVVVDRYSFDFFLHWGATPPMARYRIMGPDGTLLEELEIRRTAGGDELAYRRGDPLESAPSPALNAPIQASDLTWLDLMLDFLWWDDPVITGEETVRGFDCLIVTVAAPERHAGDYAGVRMWIEPKQYLLLQAEAFDANDRPVRRLWVTSVQRLDDEQWMIKEMESQRYPSAQRTRMRIGEVVETAP